MRNEQKTSVWVIFSCPDHYKAYDGLSEKLRARISQEIEICKSRLTQSFQNKSEFILKFVYSQDLLPRLSEDKFKPDVVLFLMESRNFEDGAYHPPYNEYELKGYLKASGIAYTGCDGLSLFSDYDKSLQYSLALSCGISTPAQTFIAHDSDPKNIAWDCFPAFVKPCLHGDSIGIRKSSVVRTRVEMLTEINRLQKLFPNEPLVIQEFLHGCEYTVGVIGNWDSAKCRTLPIIQIGFEKAEDNVSVLTHDAKNDPRSTEYMQDYYHIPNIPAPLETRLIRDTLTIYKRLKCRGYARADWRLDRHGIPKFLEINALPDIMDETSSLIKMYRHATGMEHGDFLLEIINHAIMSN